MENCPDCQFTQFTYRLKLIPTNRGEYYPKYIPQIKQLCASCGRYIKFAKQTEELIEVINNYLSEVKL